MAGDGLPWLLPVLEAMLEQFPFQVYGFPFSQWQRVHQSHRVTVAQQAAHRTNQVAPRHSNDNGLAETKNGAVIRKQIGYGHIAAPHAEAIADFYREYLSTYVNWQAEIEVDAKGGQRRRYRRYQTPLETLLT